MTRAALVLLVGLAACSPRPVPRTVTVRADSAVAAVVATLADSLAAAHPGLTVRADADAPDAEVVVTTGGSGGTALAQAGLVLVGPPGALPAPSLAAALAGARSVGASGEAARLAREALDAAGVEVDLVPFATTAAALDSVAARATDRAFALAPDALSSTAYAVIFRPAGADARAAVVRGALRPGASADARTVLDALAAPTAYRAWAAAGFRPPPR